MASNFKRIKFFEQDQIEDLAAVAKAKAIKGMKPEESKLATGEKTI